MFRHIIALAGLVLLVAAPADATVRPAEPETLPAAIKAATAGDVLVLTGVFTRPDFYAMSKRSWPAPGITFDLKAATLRDVIMNDITGVTFKGGRYEATVPKSQGLRLVRAARVTIQGGEFTAAPGITGAYGLRVVEGANVVVNGARFDAMRNGLQFHLVDKGTIANSVFTRISANGIFVGGGSGITIERNQLTDFAPGPGEHPDAIQFAKETEKVPGTKGALIRGNIITGEAQGVFGQVDDAVIVGNKIKCSFAYGIGVVGARPVVENNELSTFPAPKALQCRIVWERMPGLTVRGVNTIGAWGRNPTKTLPTTP